MTEQVKFVGRWLQQISEDVVDSRFPTPQYGDPIVPESVWGEEAAEHELWICPVCKHVWPASRDACHNCYESEAPLTEHQILDPLWTAIDLENLKSKVGQAYQVIGLLAIGTEQVPTEEEAARALDYFANEEVYDEDFLPWPRE